MWDTLTHSHQRQRTLGVLAPHAHVQAHAFDLRTLLMSLETQRRSSVKCSCGAEFSRASTTLVYFARGTAERMSPICRHYLQPGEKRAKTYRKSRRARRQRVEEAASTCALFSSLLSSAVSSEVATLAQRRPQESKTTGTGNAIIS
jgi:hypothetical protein